MTLHRRRRFIAIGRSAVFFLFLSTSLWAQQRSTDPPQIEKSLRSALTLNPDDLAANRQLADLLEQTGRTQAAISYRRHAVDLSTKQSLADQQRSQLDLAIALVEANNLDEAIPLLQSLLARDPSLQKAQYELGTAFARKDDFNAALTAYSAAARLDPHDAESQLAVAKSLITLLRYQEAETYLATAQADAASPFELHLLTGMMDRHTNRNPQAIKELQAAVSLQPNDAEANLQLAESLRDSNDSIAALTYFKRAAVLRPSVAVYFRLVTLYRALAMTAEEREASLQLTQLREAETIRIRVDVLKNQASSAAQTGDLKTALAQYQSAIKLDPTNPDLLVAAANLASRLHQPAVQQALLQQALNTSPQNAAALSGLGTLEAEKGKLTEAKAHLEQALHNDPQLPQALNSLAVLIARDGDMARAESLLQQAIESDPHFHEAFRNLGLIYASTNRPQLAEATIRRSIALDATDATGWITLGELFLNQQQAASAAQAFRSAVNVAPDNLTARLLLARSLIMGGDNTAALREVDFILQRTPASIPAMQLKAELTH